MSSGPAALCGFKFLSNLLTPSSRIMMSGIDGISLSLSVGKSDSLSCVNCDWYCIFNSSAFPLLSVTSSLLCESFSAGIPVESFFRDLMKLQNCFTEARLLFLMNFLYAFLVAFLTLFLMWRKFSQSSLLPLFLALLYALCLRFNQRFIDLVIHGVKLRFLTTFDGTCVSTADFSLSLSSIHSSFTVVFDNSFSLKSLLIPSTSAFSSVVSALL